MTDDPGPEGAQTSGRHGRADRFENNNQQLGDWDKTLASVWCRCFRAMKLPVFSFGFASLPTAALDIGRNHHHDLGWAEGIVLWRSREGRPLREQVPCQYDRQVGYSRCRSPGSGLAFGHDVQQPNLPPSLLLLLLLLVSRLHPAPDTNTTSPKTSHAFAQPLQPSGAPGIPTLPAQVILRPCVRTSPSTPPKRHPRAQPSTHISPRAIPPPLPLLSTKAESLGPLSQSSEDFREFCPSGTSSPAWRRSPTHPPLVVSRPETPITNSIEAPDCSPLGPFYRCVHACRKHIALSPGVHPVRASSPGLTPCPALWASVAPLRRRTGDGPLPPMCESGPPPSRDGIGISSVEVLARALLLLLSSFFPRVVAVRPDHPATDIITSAGHIDKRRQYQ